MCFTHASCDILAKRSITSAVIIPIWKNKEIISVLQKFKMNYVDEVVVVIDEGTLDYVTEIQESAGLISERLTILENPKRQGIGNAIRMGLRYAQSKEYVSVVIMAGNGKDDPAEIPRLLDAIQAGNDYVQGSRFLKGGSSKGTPFGRKLIVKFWPIFWTILTFRKQTEVTNGFRAYRIELLDNPKINLDQEWLNGYSMEYYLHYKFVTDRNVKHVEVPVSKIYSDNKDYTKIKPLRNFKEIALPPILLKLKIRK